MPPSPARSPGPISTPGRSGPRGWSRPRSTSSPKRWKPILDHADEMGVDVCYEIHPGEDLHDGVTFEMFLERVGDHPRANMLYDPSHYVLQCLDYLDNLDIYKDRIKMFHVKDAEFNPTGRQGVYSGYQPWVDRAGRFRSLGDGQVDFRAIFSKFAAMDFDGWAVVEWECCLKHPEDGAREGAAFVKDHIIRVTEKAFDDFADGGTDEAANRKMLGIVMEALSTDRHRPASDWAWSAAAKTPSSAACTASRPGSTANSIWSRGRSPPTPEKARASGEALGLAPDRTYGDFREMAIRDEPDRRHPGGVDRHPQPRPLSGGARVPRARHPRDLRQASDRTFPTPASW